MTFRELVTTVLLAIERDAPEHSRRAAHALGDRRAVLRVGTEVVTLAAQAGHVGALPADVEGADLELVTDREAMIDIVEGASGLLDGVESGRLRLVAEVDDLLAFDDTARWFVAGAVRSPAARLQWSQYRATIARRSGASSARREAA